MKEFSAGNAFLVLLVTGLLQHVSSAEQFVLPSVSFADLQSDNMRTILTDTLRTSLSREGILAITNVPKMQSVRRNALSTIGDCLGSATLPLSSLSKTSTSTARQGFMHQVLPDDSERRTIAAEISGKHGSGRNPNWLAPQLLAQCPELASTTEELRQLVDRVSFTVADSFDSLYPSVDRKPLFTTKLDKTSTASVGTNPHSSNDETASYTWTTFNDLIRGGDQLEHFHSYFPSSLGMNADSRVDAKALEYHTDAGLFILFVPALYSDDVFDRKRQGENSSPRKDFWFLDSNGAEHALVVRNPVGTSEGKLEYADDDGVVYVGPDTIILMIGQGSEQFLNPVLKGTTSSTGNSKASSSSSSSLDGNSATSSAITDSARTSSNDNVRTVRADLSDGLRACPHALTLQTTISGTSSSGSSSSSSNSPRNWYGRMFLPPADAWLSELQSTYGEARERVIRYSTAATASTTTTSSRTDSSTAIAQEDKEAQWRELSLYAGCGQHNDGAHVHASMAHTPSKVSSGASATVLSSANDNDMARGHSQLRSNSNNGINSLSYETYHLSAKQPLVLEQNRLLMDCPEGQIYCWMDCMSYTSYNLTCPTSEITCVDSSGNPTDPGDQDSNNHPGCPGDAWVDPGGFCQGTGTTMYMQGFVSYVTGNYRTDGGSQTPQCLTLWLEDWILDTRTKFAAACFGCIILGILTEGITAVRRLARSVTWYASYWTQLCTMASLYGAQLAFGYFAMLVCMTYQVELFVCVVAGLAIGHGMFNFRAHGPAAEQMLADAAAAGDEHSVVTKSEIQDMVDPCCSYMHLEDEPTSGSTTGRTNGSISTTNNRMHHNDDRGSSRHGFL